MKSRLLSGFVSVLLGKVGVLLIGIATTPILVRLLTSSQYGEYAFILSAHALLVTVTSSGIFNGLRKYIAENRSEDGWKDYVFGFYTQLGLGVSLVTALGISLLTFTGIVDLLFQDIDDRLFYLLGALLVGDVLYKIGRGSLMGLHLERYSEPLQVLRRLTFAITAVSLVYVGFGASGAILGKVAGMFLACVVSLAVLQSSISLSGVANNYVGRAENSNFLAFNAQSILLAFLTTSLYNVDILLLQPFAGSQATGYYKAALVIAEFLWFVPTALQYSLVQSTSRMWADDEHDQITGIASKITRYTFLFTLLLVLGLAALAEPFVSFYFGADYVSSTMPLVILLPGVLGFAIARPIFAIGQGKGDLTILNKATGTAAVLNLVLNLLLIPNYGMMGAAVATSIGYGVMAVLHILAARRIGFDPATDVRFLRISLTGLVAGVVIFAVAGVISSDLVSLLLVPPVGFVVYSVTALLTGAVDSEDISELKELISQ